MRTPFKSYTVIMSARPLSLSVFLYLGLSFSFSDTKILVVAGEREKEKGNWAPKIVGGREREAGGKAASYHASPKGGITRRSWKGGRPLICFSCGGGGGGRRTRNVVIKRAKKTFPPLFFLGMCSEIERQRKKRRTRKPCSTTHRGGRR